jgi:4-amino-4-deoxy-L-arabinose transferase-like glycosyltransferase
MYIFLSRTASKLKNHNYPAPLKTFSGITAQHLSIIGLIMAITIGALLPLNLLAGQRLHHDEALYATWALEIASGQNPGLDNVPIDKPPLFLYAAAGAMWLLGPTETAARLPSLIATGAIIGLTYRLGQTLYNRRVGLLAAWLAALSPFTIQFAPTAFTDPLLTALVLAAGVAAAGAQSLWAGVWLGLAIATKQQALFFAPLIAALLALVNLRQKRQDAPAQPPGRTLHFLAGLLLILLPLFLWDARRGQLPGFWQLGAANYGGVTINIIAFAERWQGFADLLTYATASPVLTLIFLAGLPLLLAAGLWPRSRAAALTDWLLALFVALFLLGHAALSFQVWDRYLLGLIPLLALLLARVLLWPQTVITTVWNRTRPKLAGPANWLTGLALVIILIGLLTGPARDAANGRFPLGSQSRSLAGLEQTVAYLRGNVGANTTLYHHWLGTHWRFYLWDYPYDLQYWESPQALAAKAKPGHLIAFPAWETDTPARLALAQNGLTLQEIQRAYHPAGYPSIILYRLELAAE